jgi:glutaredoxin 3
MDATNTQTVVFYSKDNCPYCDYLQADLEKLKIPYKKVTITSTNRQALIEFTKCKTVPQLFIGGSFAGGYQQFVQLLTTGKLKTLLAQYDIVI